MFTKRYLLLSVILMDLLTGMEFDLFVPSFPILQDQFQLTPFLVELLLSVNFIGYCISLFFVGGLADRYGRKPVIVGGILTFIVGTLLCLFASSYYFLLTGRLLEGIGVAAPAILSFLIIADTYTLKKQQYYMAMLNGLMNGAVAAAPVLGSYITLHFHWQGNFKALLLISSSALIMTIFSIPSTRPMPSILTDAAIENTNNTFQLPSAAIPSQPASGYITILKSKTVMLLILNMICMYSPYWVFVGMSPLLYIKDLGVSLSYFGFYQGSLALVFALGSVLFGLVVERLNQKTMLELSNLLFVISFILIGYITYINSNNAFFITLMFLPFIIAQVIPTTILYPLCMNYIPEMKGRIAAVMQSSRLILSAIGLQISGYLYNHTFQNIGIITLLMIIVTVVTLFFITQDKRLMQAT